jgi:hypothetical protein
MGVIIVIGVLLLLVTHAGSKVVTLEASVNDATNAQTDLPPNTSVAATGANPTPSPATALGAPGASQAAITRLEVNSRFALPNPTFYAVSAEQAGLSGVPLPAVPGRNFNGFNAVPARTKSLLTGAQPATTSSGGDVVYHGDKL